MLVAEALAAGDMGPALPILAPGGRASALTHWGADQQATYLKEFAGENVYSAGLRGHHRNPQPLFDPTRLEDHCGAHSRPVTGLTA